MTKKLFAFAKGECAAESADNPMTQEVLLAGHLYLMVVKVRSFSYQGSQHDPILDNTNLSELLCHKVKFFPSACYFTRPFK